MRFILLAGMFPFLMTAAFNSACAKASKSYTIPEIRIEASIHADGSVRITEHRTYVFDGSFSWADYRLPLQGFKDISDITIREGDHVFINANTKKNGTFSVAKSSKSIQLKWYYSADSEQRTFTVSYTLKGAITQGPEWSQFFWNFLSSSREKATKQLTVNLRLSRAIAPDSVQAWSRGPEGQINTQKTNDGFLLSATSIDKDQSVTLRAVFPSSIFEASAATIHDSDFSLAWARQNEQQYKEKLAEQKQRDAYWANIGRQANYIIVLLSIGIFYLIYVKYGKRHSAGHVSTTPTVLIPDGTRPAVAGWLLFNRNVSSSMLLATVLDLARRGYLMIKEQPPEKGFFSGHKTTFTIERTQKEPEKKVLDWENDILNFTEKRLSEDITRLDKVYSGRSREAAKWFRKWNKTFKNYCFDLGWIDMNSYKGLWLNLGLQLPLLAAAIFALVFAGPPAVASVVVCSIAFFLSFAIIRRTPAGEEKYHRWKAYRKGLRDASDYTIPSDTLGKHFINAVALGISKKEMEQLFKTADDANIVFYWMVFSGGHSPSAAQMASTFTTLYATGSSSFAGTSAGAGASAGAAGGGAAGGAG